MRPDEEKRRLLQRLRRIEGQIRGIARMIEEDKYCVDILIQVAAARAALNKVGLRLFEEHAKTCIVQALKTSNEDEVMDDLMDVIMKFIK